MSTYKQAGVNIDAGNMLVERIKPMAASTKREGTMEGLGGFGALFDLYAAGYEDPVLVSCTDGVGTKLRLAIETGIHHTVGIDLVAMCVNDLIVQGAEPLFFLDYFATGKLHVDQATAVVEGIAEGCRQAGCALVGGETAEMPGMYGKGDYDLAGFSVGAVDRNHLLPRFDDIKEGDRLFGLASSGVHSNGFSLVRHIMKQKGLKYSDKAEFDASKTYGQVFLEPTRIYVKSCLPAIRRGGVKGLAHITGGGLVENVPRILPKHLAADIKVSSWPLPPLFQWLQKAGNVPKHEMLRTFNCGIGMVVIIEETWVEHTITMLEDAGEQIWQIGKVVRNK